MEEEKVAPAPDKKDSKTPQKGLSGQKKILLIASTIFVLVAIGGAFWVGSRRKGQEPESSPTPTSTPEEEEAIESPSPSPEESPSPTPSPTPESTPEPKADLHISEYSFDPEPEKTVEFIVTIGLHNQGDAATGPFWWEWWPTAHSYACRERISGGIAAGGERIVTCTYTYGGWSNYPTKAVADTDNEIDESDETNNTHTENVVPIH